MTLLHKHKRRSKKGNIVVTKVYKAGRNRRGGNGRDNGSCFPAGTQVLTPTGYREIEAFKPGDLIETLDNGTRTIQTVTKRLKFSASQLIELGIENDGTLKSTYWHSLSTQRGWVPAGKMRVGDQVHCIRDGKCLKLEVKQITTSKTSCEVFNLVTTGPHTYVVEGIVVHNFTFFRTIRTILHQLLLDRIAIWHDQRSVFHAKSSMPNMGRISTYSRGW